MDKIYVLMSEGYELMHSHGFFYEKKDAKIVAEKYQHYVEVIELAGMDRVDVLEKYLCKGESLPVVHGERR